MDALVLVGDVEEAASVGYCDALYARQVRELADELGVEGAGVGRKNGAEVGRDGVPAAGVVAYEDAPFVAAVHVAGYEVHLFAVGGGEEGEVAHAGDVAPAADGVHDPEAENFWWLVAGLEEALDSFELDEDGMPVGGDGEAEAQQERPALAEGGALDVDRVVVLAHEARPFFALVLAALYGGLDQGLAGRLAERDQVRT